jgi:hypothetical protein
MNNTPQGGAIEDNAADDILMVARGVYAPLTFISTLPYYEKILFSFGYSK